MTPEEVFCTLSEIPEAGVFEYKDKYYRRLKVDPDTEMNPEWFPCVTYIHEFKFIPRDITVRRCKDFGDRFWTDEEAAAAEAASNKYSIASNAIASRVRQAILGYRRKAGTRPLDWVKVFYSAYDTDDNDIPIDNLDEIAVHGKVKLVSNNPGWERKPYESEVVENPTWLQVAVFANEMILTTGDTHHVFLEGVNLLDLAPEEPTGLLGIPVYEIVMGS